MPLDFVMVLFSRVPVDQVDDGAGRIFIVDIVQPVACEGIISVIHLKPESLCLSPKVDAIAHFPVAHFSAGNLLQADDRINKELEVCIVDAKGSEPAIGIFF